MFRVMRRDFENHVGGSYSKVRLLTVPSLVAFSVGASVVAHQPHPVIRMVGLFMWGLGVVGFIFGIRITEDIRDSEIVREECRKAWRAGWLHHARHPFVDGDPEFGNNPFEPHFDTGGYPHDNQVL